MDIQPTTTEYVNGAKVAIGVFIADAFAVERVLGSTIKVGGRCIATRPPTWRAAIVADGEVAWEGDTFATQQAASAAVAVFAQETMRKAVRALFTDVKNRHD